MFERHSICALILAGGQGSRLGGRDKGLEAWQGRPIIAHQIERIRPQVGRIRISANRNLEHYARFGLPVVSDLLADYPGPLAGLHAALAGGDCELLLTLPCDAPLFPADLAPRLLAALGDGDAAVVAAPQREPMFALYRARCFASLDAFLRAGERRVGGWQRQLDCRSADFSDQPGAFANLNTPEDWAASSARPADAKG
ncbi:MAG: hypothetical protein RIR00_254, partial [Pseudomonadota bacterium]